MPESTSVVVDIDYLSYAERQHEEAPVADVVAALRVRFKQAAIALVATDRADDGLQALAASISATLVASENADVQIAVYAMRELERVQRFALVSGDGDYAPVLQEAKRRDVRTALVSYPESTASAISFLADEKIHPMDLPYVVEGLIAPGEGGRAKRALMLQFMAARSEIAIVDPYIGEETVQMLAWTWANEAVAVTLVGDVITSEAKREASTIKGLGRSIRLIRNRDAHDRWFCIDGQWWHSGGSLKDLGLRYSRIAKVDAIEVAGHDEMLNRLVREGAAVNL